MSKLWTADPRETLRVTPDFDLAAFDRGSAPGFSGDQDDAAKLMARRGDLLSELQERLFATGRAGGDRNVLVVVQGIDTAGKGGIARHVMGLVDPQGVALRSFGVPTAEERRHHYLWRIKRALPRPGQIGLFDRSHYEDVLVVRVDSLVAPEVWQKRYAEINRWEKSLVDSGTKVLKFAMMVSKDEQAMRLMERIDRPDKRWKYSAGDLDTRAKWDAYQDAYADVFRLTSTTHAPWYVLPADRKWYPRLAVTEILTRALIDLDLKWPRPLWRPDVQRRRLVADMPPEKLAESLSATEEVVSKANAESLEVRTEVAEIRTQRKGEPALQRALAAIDAKRAELDADLAATLKNKADLLTEVAPALAFAAAMTGPDKKPDKSRPSPAPESAADPGRGAQASDSLDGQGKQRRKKKKQGSKAREKNKKRKH